jgi:hypothetical protein
MGAAGKLKVRFLPHFPRFEKQFFHDGTKRMNGPVGAQYMLPTG